MPDDASLPGLHHVTVLSGAAQDTLDFYGGVLGLRRVKTTVNFDDPTTHHLYYGDTVGRPGTLFTVFPWPRARQGRPGAGMVQALAFAVPASTLDDWAARLDEAGVPAGRSERFGAPVLEFEDPSGLSLALVGHDTPPDGAWTDGPVPAGQALRALHAPTLPVFADDRTPELLTDLFGWAEVGTDGDRLRLQAPAPTQRARHVDLLVRDRHPAGRMGQGTVHHLAFRAPDAAAQRHWQQALRERDIQVTDVKDRQYFQSIYFRDPAWTSGLLFEIATDGPGFLIDEDEATLGETLQLPPQFEGRRADIQSALPPLSSPR